MNCTEVQALAPELALGLVTGEDRGEALVHLDECSVCRAQVDALAAAAENVLLVAPSATPPDGFAERAMERIDREPAVLSAHRGRRRRITLVGAAAAALVAIVAAALSLVGPGAASANEIEVTMRTPAGKEVGDAYLHHDDTSWVLVDMDAWRNTNEAYDLRLELDDGKTVEVPGGNLQTGAGAWGTRIDVDASHVRSVALVGHDGRVWCSGTVS